MIYEEIKDLWISLGFDLSTQEYVQFYLDKDNSVTAVTVDNKKYFAKSVNKMLDYYIEEGENSNLYKSKCIALFDHSKSKVLKLDIDLKNRDCDSTLILNDIISLVGVTPIYIAESRFEKGLHLYFQMENSISDSVRLKFTNYIQEKQEFKEDCKIDRICSTSLALRPIGIKDYNILNSNFEKISIQECIESIKVNSCDERYILKNRDLMNKAFEKENSIKNEKENSEIKYKLASRNRCFTVTEDSENPFLRFPLTRDDRITNHFKLAHYCYSQKKTYKEFIEYSLENHIDSKDMNQYSIDGNDKFMRDIWNYVLLTHVKKNDVEDKEYIQKSPNGYIRNNILHREHVERFGKRILDLHFAGEHKSNRLRIRKDIETIFYELWCRYYYDIQHPQKASRKVRDEKIKNAIESASFSLPNSLVELLIKEFDLKTAPRTLKEEILKMFNDMSMMTQLNYTERGWLNFDSGTGYCKQFILTSLARKMFFIENEIELPILKNEEYDSLVFISKELKTKNEKTSVNEILSLTKNINVKMRIRILDCFNTCEKEKRNLMFNILKLCEIKKEILLIEKLSFAFVKILNL